MKRKFYLLIVIALLSVILMPSAALADTANVFDYADLISQNDEDSLQQMTDSFRESYSGNLIFLTVGDAGGRTSTRIATDFFAENNFNEDSAGGSALFLFNMDALETYIITSGDMADLLNRDRIDELLYVQSFYLDGQEIYKAMSLTVDYMDAYAYIGPISIQSAAPSISSTASKVFDQADLLTSGQKKNLQQSIDAFIEQHNADMVVVTTDDTGGKTSREYADDYFDYNGFGLGSDKSGVLFLINMDARETYISTSGDMIDILNDDRIDDLLDIQTPYLKDGDYYGALALSIDRTGGYAAAGPVAGQYRQPESSLSLQWIIISILIGAGIGGLAVLIIHKIYKKEYQAVPYDYQNQARLNLKTKKDTLIDTKVTSHYIPPPSSHGSSSGFGSSSGLSSTHSSSSGSTHGGGGRGF